MPGVVFRRFFQISEWRVDIRKVSAVAHRVYRENVFSPHLLVALCEVSRLVMLLCNLAHPLNAQQCVFMPPIAHIPKTLIIFVVSSRSTARFPFSVASFFCAYFRGL